nr:myopalladin isoform X2 [Geotrypetes seraphini]XP_033797642.1 myopalladin isoform X2 [Geotrypetes seraphini]XP_033797643.1 myopalladin isoform X2 [Geotrypetes seraphini]XP_033797644.1 myopalladin isoform X2 [Geotrypetes seraphini]XP_033797645.1 myopalladin isoform X2 [Geotrypetes seraphini]
MQDEGIETSTSISQLLKESYLAETRVHHENSERSRSDPSPDLNRCGTSGSSEEVVGQDDLTDLSAFLSQEELDESVNLARQAIDHTPQEKKQGNKHRQEELKNTTKIVSNTQTTESTGLSASSEKGHHSNFHQEQADRDTKSCRESSQDLRKQQRLNPYGSETENKKEFLNKAADFIEELSSLFKTHSSKIRPKLCKNHRAKYESKNRIPKGSGFDLTNLSENRERPQTSIPIEAEKEPEPVPEIQEIEQEEQEELENSEAAIELEATELTPEASPASLYFQDPIVQSPSFIQKLKSREIPEGARVQLDCIVVGIPTPEVRWYCEGQELENSPDIQIIQTGNLHSLIISEAFEEDTGRYSCFASNIHGTDSTSAEIYIEGASSSESEGDQKEEMAQVEKSPSTATVSSHTPSTVSQDVTQGQSAVAQQASPSSPQQNQSTANYLQGLDGRPIIAAPVFTKMLQDLTASESQLVVFECRVKGAPSPKVEWYREGTLIEDSPDFRILQKKPRSMAEPEEICTLVITEVLSEDSGTFTCTASNKYGTVSSTARLNVRGSENNSSGAALIINTINLEAFKQQPLPSNPTCPAPEQPQKPKLEGVLVNHNEPRSSSKIGLRVHFKLPEDDKGSEASSEDGVINGQTLNTSSPTSPSKEPPPVLAKPKLDPGQLQQLHKQVLSERHHLQSPSPFPAPTRQFQANMNVMNNTTSSIQQLTTTAYKQSMTAHQQTFTHTRPKQFFATSPSSSAVPLLSSMPQENQRKENLLGPSSPVPAEPQTVYSGRTEQYLKTSKEFVLPPSLHYTSGQNQFQVQTTSPPPASPTVRIQNPVAFLSSVLPSLPPSLPATNAMGLPKAAPSLPSPAIILKPPRSQRLAAEEAIHGNKDAVVRDLERKLHVREDFSHNEYLQTTTDEEKLARRLLGPNTTPSVFINETIHDTPSQEYKISNFEQRLMNEIEFRLQRTPVDESDDEIEHDEIPTGKCIAPVFDKRLKHFRVVEGSAITFTCKIVGIPVPKVYWFKDGTQISKKNDHYKMKREADGTCSLHIEATTNDDDGNYTIMAANPQGRISCSGHLLMQTVLIRPRMAPVVQSHRMRSHVQEAEGEPVQERFFRPYFLQAPGDMVAHEGRLCRLDCKVSGLPTPDLLWLLNGKPVVKDATHKMLIRENSIHSLLIDPLTQRDAGTYTCIATNKTGQNSFSLELSVVAKEVKKAPLFLEKLQNCGVPEGHPVRLESRVVGMPPPIFYWKKDNDTISPNKQRISMHEDTTGYVCLVIQPAKKEDAGWYTLSAKNEAGIVSCTARLDIYAQWHRQLPQQIKKVRSSGNRYAALTGQGLDILSAFPSVANPLVFSPSSLKTVESEEL